jgi:hypothetical protein
LKEALSSPLTLDKKQSISVGHKHPKNQISRKFLVKKKSLLSHELFSISLNFEEFKFQFFHPKLTKLH